MRVDEALERLAVEALGPARARACARGGCSSPNRRGRCRRAACSTTWLQLSQPRSMTRTRRRMPECYRLRMRLMPDEPHLATRTSPSPRSSPACAWSRTALNLPGPGGVLAPARPGRDASTRSSRRGRPVRGSTARLVRAPARGRSTCTASTSRTPTGLRRAWTSSCCEADLLVTAQRPSALARLGLGARALAERFPRLCHVAITGHPPPRRGTRRATTSPTSREAGLLTPPAMPPTLFADMAGAERAVTTALALRDRARSRPARRTPRTRRSRRPRSGSRSRAPRASRRPARCWAAGYAGYNIYAAKRRLDRGRGARAALRPRRSPRRCSIAPASMARGSPRASPPRPRRTGKRGRAPRDLPIAALRTPSPPERLSSMQIANHAFLVAGGGSGPRRRHRAHARRQRAARSSSPT